MELPFALVVITEMLDTWSKLSSKYESVSGNGLSLDGLYLDGSKNAYPLPAYGMKPDVLETPPKTLAESPYAANDGFAAVNAAAPCVQNGGFREIHLVRFLFAKAMIHPEREEIGGYERDKISFSLPKTLEAKEEQIREQTISISCCFSTPSFLKIEMRIASRILSSRANARPSDRSSVRIEVGFVLFRNEHAKHHHRVHSKKRARVLQPNCRQKNKKKSISLLRTANKDIACLRSTVSSLDAKVTFEVRETDFTERCRFKLSVLATDAFALMWMDWTIEAIIIRIYFCVLL